jgi:urease accessory protein
MDAMTEIGLAGILPHRPQRAVGRLALAFKYDEPSRRTRIERFYQEGCLRSRLPRATESSICDAVLVNISGGIAGGDGLTTSITVGSKARVCVAGQAAERVYKALGTEPARVKTTISVGQGGALEYLPQEAILFDGFALDRSLEIELAEEADFLGVESIVFGRLAMGENLRLGTLRDRISLHRNGKLLLCDMTRLDGDLAHLLGRNALANGAVAMATIIYAAPDAAAKLEAIRAALHNTLCDAGASAFEGMLIARILAPSCHALRAAIIDILQLCRNGRAMPRVWQG